MKIQLVSNNRLSHTASVNTQPVTIPATGSYSNAFYYGLVWLQWAAFTALWALAVAWTFLSWNDALAIAGWIAR